MLKFLRDIIIETIVIFFAVANAEVRGGRMNVSSVIRTWAILTVIVILGEILFRFVL